MRNIFILILFCFSIMFTACNPQDIWQNDSDKDVSSVESVNNTEVEIIFNHEVEELSAENISNYSIEGLDVLSIERDDTDLSRVQLTTSSQSSIDYTVVITNVERTDGELIDTTASPDTFTGDALPEVLNVVATSNTAVDVILSEAVDPDTARNADNYSITGLSISSVSYDENASVVHLTTDSQIYIEYSLTASNLLDLTGNTISANLNTFTGYYFCVADAVAVNNTHVDVIFSSYVELTSGENTANYTINSGGLSVISATRDSSDNSIVHLVTDSQEEIIYNLVVSSSVLSQNGEVVGSPDSDSFTGDALPGVTGVSSIISDSITLNFSEEVNSTNADVPGNYSIVGSDSSVINVLTATASGTSVVLTTDYQSDISYTVTVSNVTDMTGNVIDPANDTVTYTGNACPRLLSVTWMPNNELELIFSEAVEETLSETIGNYSIAEGLNITGAERDSVDYSIVYLTTDAQADITYTLTVSNLEDLSGNLLNPNPDTATFTGNACPYIVNVNYNGTMMIDVEYSEVMDSTTFELDKYQVFDITSTPIEIGVDYVSGSDNTAHLMLNATFESGHQYQLVVNASVQDPEGNNLLTPYIVPFSYP